MEPTHSSSRLILVLLNVLINIFFCSPAAAGNWAWGSNVGVNSVWNDNPALADDALDPRSTFRFLATYNGEFTRLAANNSFAFTPRITRDYYPDKDFQELESTNIFLPSNFTWSRPRTNFALALNLSRQNILSDEASLADGTNVSFLNADDTLYVASIAPSFSWTVTERDQVLLNVSAATNNYDLDFTNRADSDTAATQFTYLRSVTSTQSLGFTASAFTLNSERLSLFGLPLPTVPPTFQVVEARVENQSDSTSITLDYNFDLSSRTRFTLKFGLQDTNTDNTIVATDTGEILATNEFPFESTTYNLAFLRALESGEYRVTLGRTVTPATNGQPQDRYELGFNGDLRHSRKLSSRWRFLLWQQQNVVLSATDGGFSRKTRFFSGEYTLSWQITQKWRLNGLYRYRYRSRDASINDMTRFTANSNELLVGITYIWKSFERQAKPIPTNRQ